MRCPKCTYEVEDSLFFCPQCGQDLSKSDNASPSEVVDVISGTPFVNEAGENEDVGRIVSEDVPTEAEIPVTDVPVFPAPSTVEVSVPPVQAPLSAPEPVQDPVSVPAPVRPTISVPTPAAAAAVSPRPVPPVSSVDSKKVPDAVLVEPEIPKPLKPVTTAGAFWFFLLTSIPFVGLIVLVCLATIGRNKNRKSISRAILLWRLVFVLASCILFTVLFFLNRDFLVEIFDPGNWYSTIEFFARTFLNY